MNRILIFLKSNIVFIVSITCSLAIILFGAFNSSGLAKLSEVMMGGINRYFCWLFLVAMFAILCFLIWLGCSKYGKIKLGGIDTKPDHSRISWFMMLFCAGTGIGLVFWSISEPLTHYVNPPAGIESATQESANFAIRTSFLHWGFIPWACFALVGLSLAIFHFRKGKKALISSTLTPLIGEKKVGNFIGKIIDILTVLITVAGIATSLGLGCMQICGGLEFLFDIKNSEITWLIVILSVTVIFIISSITGIKKGIKILSNVNSILAIVLLLLVFIIGPTSGMLNTLVNGLGEHFNHFIEDSLSINNLSDNSWVLNWRVFYWAWWISWSPFVGMFIARISKGRTIKEFITGVIIIPSLFTFIWYAVFGCFALNVAGEWSIEALREIVSHPDTAVFIVMEKYPIGNILSFLTVLLLTIFFITSADSATFSLAIFSSNGDVNPPIWKKIIWGVIEAAIAYILLCSGGLKPLQTISIAAALPYIFVLLIMIVCLIKTLRQEQKPILLDASSLNNNIEKI